MSPTSATILAAVGGPCQSFNAPKWSDLLTAALLDGTISKGAQLLGTILLGHYSGTTGKCWRSMLPRRRRPEHGPTLP